MRKPHIAASESCDPSGLPAQQPLDEGDAAARHRHEVGAGLRFAFGRNWTRFLRYLDDARIDEAKTNLQDFLQVASLSGLTFVDIGSGSGLSSLAARYLGAAVSSFDYDTESVACTRELKRRYFPNDPSWTICQGSVLDQDFLRGLGEFDIVYSWGVLHHTGDMWRAMENVKPMVKPGGKLFLAIYNDFGEISRWWLARKRRYQRLPRLLRPLYVAYLWTPQELRLLAGYLRAGELNRYINEVFNYRKGRGMSRLHDIVDWVGGYPYEYATLSSLIEFYQSAGFAAVKVQENSSYGCHQVVFRRLS
ncbi:MAG TPA: class I SAM-dependent methyltransferase [Stellaceae bacterium]|jgi:2-polyprenyl-6-hydroxyphenyl methylase/3-demethylubiquinone-9 3-methyltransferase|nr:class I SAM-dependent methyltransferase [Stellaceae bacterium]